jgi:SAM-dependent methyltransferase
MTVSLGDDRGVVTIEPLGNGRSRVSVSLAAKAPMPIASCETAYPPELIECLLRVKGPAYLCQEIVRGEDPSEILRQLNHDVLSYVNPEEFAGRRILDFACGCGASSMALLKFCRLTHVVGVDLRADCIEAAREVAAFYGFGGGDILSLD